MSAQNKLLTYIKEKWEEWKVFSNAYDNHMDRQDKELEARRAVERKLGRITFGDEWRKLIINI